VTLDADTKTLEHEGGALKLYGTAGVSFDDHTGYIYWWKVLATCTKAKRPSLSTDAMQGQTGISLTHR